ncbi:type 2 lanthipeptide synthetase LanM [Halobaculum sp. MBLA0143]|uniref:type 2 lanthipeptide synthetase LanM n=1 Tax=Halobaculum sp. MBLA0143 TaxID=3079933 RepID=UPI00352437BB
MNPDYHKIAARGESLTERVRHEHRERRAEHTEETRELLSEFGEIITTGYWNGERIDRARAARYVAFERWPAPESLPEWVTLLDDLLSGLDPTDSSVPDHLSDVPFGPVLSQYVETAWERFDRAAPTELWTDDAIDDCQRVLATRLAEVLARAHHVDFVRYVAQRDTAVVREGRLSADSTEWYDQYITAVLESRAADFFEEYAVGARLLVETIDQWHDSFKSFAERFASDDDALESLLRTDPQRVTGLTAAGDRHDENDCVLLVEFDEETEAVYKPRGLETEQTVHDLTADLAAADVSVPELPVPSLLDRGDYGWVEVVTQESHDTVDSVASYYRRAGALLAVAYVLYLTDCHCENVIATADGPVVVDLETIFEMDNRPATGAETDVQQAARTTVFNSSVLGTNLLPQGSLPRSVSGYAGIEGRETSAEMLDWKNLGTDGIDVDYTTVKAERDDNFPTYDGRPIPPKQFQSEIVDGFEQTYDAIDETADSLAPPLADRFEEIETRLLLRTTRAYESVRRAAHSPTNLRHGVRYDAEIRRTLSLRRDRPVLEQQTSMTELDDRRWDRIVAAEHEALHRGDVPRFTTTGDDPGLYFDGRQIVEHLTERTGVQRVRERLEQLGPMDRRRQRGLICAALSSPRVVPRIHPDGKV